MTRDDMIFRILNLTPMEGQAMRHLANEINLENGEDPVKFAEDMATVADEDPAKADVAAACRSLAMKLSTMRKSLAH